MATLPIYLEVEDTQVGPLLIKLRSFPGIVKLDLDLLGTGHKSASKQPSNGHDAPAPRGIKANLQPQVIAVLMKQGPINARDIATTLNVNIKRIYGVAHALKAKGIITNGGENGEYSLTDKARQELQQEHGDDSAMKLLPKPRAAETNGHAVKPSGKKTGPGGRASPGESSRVLRTILADDTKMRPIDIGAKLVEFGMSAKGLSGALNRAKRDGIIKKVDGLYQLTAKGQKLEPVTATAGA